MSTMPHDRNPVRKPRRDPRPRCGFCQDQVLLEERETDRGIFEYPVECPECETFGGDTGSES